MQNPLVSFMTQKLKSLQWCSRFKSSGMLCHVEWQVVTSISKDHGAVIFRVEQSMKSGLLDFENEGTKSLRMSVTIYQLVQGNTP
jgi:hypothetical protein